MNEIKIIDTNENNVGDFAICGYKNKKNIGYAAKIDWLKKRFNEGYKNKILFSEKDGAVGGIEYASGENSWRPVSAKGYMVIQCIYIMKKNYQAKGYGKLLLNECIKDAKKKKMNGVVVVTRKSSWLAGEELFFKNGFDVYDEFEPDFKLLAKIFIKNSPEPYFINNNKNISKKYNKGLFIFKSDQCPYLGKCIPEIIETAEKKYNIKPTIIDLNNSNDLQKSPCAFGIFCIIYNGNIIADHPISSTRFYNIMKNI